ncbi:peroxiredoxin 2, partial [Epithele typhae]|uniref:peroxiredoxin 2 n=1 Tax=Epithele typhae TaxID=378194 RepID=UPI002008DC71
FCPGDLPARVGDLGPDLKLPLIAERNVSISRDHGVPIEDEGIALRRQPQGHHQVRPQRADRAQRPRRPPLSRGNDPAIRLVKTFQSTDEHGEMCPAN